MVEDKQGILLESGTNELEIIEFSIGSIDLGINVMKVREVINIVPVTETPDCHSSVEGVIQLREEVIPVVDLAKALKLPPSENPEHDKFIIAELNKMKVAFHVHSVSRIHRISWEQINKPTELSQGLEQTTIGIIKVDGRLIMLIDFEKIVVEISPEAGINKDRLKELGTRQRSEKHILIAEDSAILRKLLEETLTEAGYANLHLFEDGRKAWDHLESLANDSDRPITEHYQMIISDIEMPQMDGHHLTKRIKEHHQLKSLPVVIFSSLISDDLRHKGERVGVDAQVTKPEIAELVKVIDRLIL